MADLRRFPSDSRTKFDAEALRRLAEKQHGVVSRGQLADCGLTDATLARWLDAGRLHRLHCRVYAVGHTALSLDGRLFAALLYGGDQAVFSHTTAAWIWSLIDTEPRRIHLTAPGRRRSLPDVRIHHSREVDPVEHQGLPVTSVPRTLVDLGSVLSPRRLRRALAEADYRGLLDPVATLSTLGRGRPGSRALRGALAHHLPSLAETDGRLEERFLELCESARLPLPKVNPPISRMRVDAVWEEQRLAVEVDGGPAHGSWARIKRDRQRELALRAEGFQVIRYTWEQVTGQPDEVAADLRRLLDL
jgi:very-short-patch-repair endonuclease